MQVKYCDELDVPSVLGELMQRLQGDFPAVPEILGNLVPHQVNPWIGSAPEGADDLASQAAKPLRCCSLPEGLKSKYFLLLWRCATKHLHCFQYVHACAGSSTGLHHDYHDNLYCLLKGRKRFRVFPPAMAHQLYTHGNILKVHPNGRIVYPDWVRMCLSMQGPPL